MDESLSLSGVSRKRQFGGMLPTFAGRASALRAVPLGTSGSILKIGDMYLLQSWVLKAAESFLSGFPCGVAALDNTK